MKRFFVGSFVAILSIVSLVFLGPLTNIAAIDCNVEAARAKSDFLSFPTWYRGLPLEHPKIPDNGSFVVDDTRCTVGDSTFKGKKPHIPIITIALNIIDIALRIVGIVAVGFVIWGGFQYIISRGEPERAKSGLVTIRNALVGMVIAMVAAMVVSFIVSRLSA
jgi:hypothetical protein